MIRIFITILFFTSVFVLPWYATVFLGVIIIGLWNGYIEVILGGILLDAVFGAGSISLGEISVLYTGLFVFLSIFAQLLRRVIIE